MEYKSKQGDPSEIDRWEAELKANGYIRVDAMNRNILKPGQYLRHEFRGTANSFDGPAQSRIECRVRE